MEQETNIPSSFNRITNHIPVHNYVGQLLLLYEYRQQEAAAAAAAEEEKKKKKKNNNNNKKSNKKIKRKNGYLSRKVQQHRFVSFDCAGFSLMSNTMTLRNVRCTCCTVFNHVPKRPLCQTDPFLFPHAREQFLKAMFFASVAQDTRSSCWNLAPDDLGLHNPSSF